MPSSLLFAINNEGRIYTLSTTGSMWRELQYVGQEFKKLSAVPHFLWAVGGDHQIYVYVHGLDIPIRVKEEAYENERWLPLEGFSSRLLPTDRYHFSSADGTVDRSIDKIRLPSMAWHWEKEWHLDTTLDGQPLDHTGWSYAVDFPAQYHAQKQWKSCVRRRKWIRYRRYSAMNSWCAIAPLHKDPTQEPFIDVSVGGQSIPGGVPGTMLVWAVTAQGRVMFRTGVTTTSPEGLRWTSIPLPQGCEVNQLSVGPTGLVWALLLNGRALVRSGVGRDSLTEVERVQIVFKDSSGKAATIGMTAGILTALLMGFRAGVAVGFTVSALYGASKLLSIEDFLNLMSSVEKASLVEAIINILTAGSASGSYTETYDLLLDPIITSAILGETWLEVRPPGDNLRLTHVSVGVNAVWAITSDKHVWFRKGIRGDAANVSEDMAIGSGWVEMVGNMAIVTVAPNDQVWAVGSEDRCIYFRTGVTISELTGKKWRMVQAAMQLSRASSNASLISNNSHHRHSLTGTSREKHRSWTSLNRPHSTYESSSVCSRDCEEQSRSAPTPTSLRLRSDKTQNMNDSSQSRDSISESSDNGDAHKNGVQPEEITGKHFETTLKNPKAWSPVRSVGSVVGTEAHPETDCSVWDADLTRDSGVFGEDEDAATLYWAEFDVMWSWVEAGACIVDPTQYPPNWFVDVGSVPQADLNQPWRIEILDALKSRIPPALVSKFDTYEAAIETSSWMRTGEARCLLSVDGNYASSAYEDCVLQLEWIGNTGTFTLLNPDGATTKSQFSLSEVTCVVCCSEPGNPRLAIHTPRLSQQPLKLQFSGDTDMEEWMANLTSVCCQVYEVQGRPSNASIWVTTALGDVFVFDPITMEMNQQQGDMYVQDFDVVGKETPYEIILHNGCALGTVIEITGCVHDDADRISLNLAAHPVLKIRHKAQSEIRFVPLHFNPRFLEDIIVRNSMVEGEWGTEEREGGIPLARGNEFAIKIMCEEDGYRIHINDSFFTFYNHRLPPQTVHKLEIDGKVKLFKVTYQCKQVIISPLEMFWRQMGGHLRRVETCMPGITWGIGYDHTAWVYTGGWGGAFLKGLESSSNGIHSMSDTQDYLVYENQRWNPLTGYTSTGLPTDRYMWSDVTGKHKRTREHAKLLSMHWHWVSDWVVDFHTPGGVDRDGWQYAVDFPATYHAQKHFTDYVRRRRWYRRCAISTNGPWQELGNTKILDVSMQPVDDSVDCLVYVWAVAARGDAIFRRGVSQSNPTGTVWEHVPCDQPLSSISCGPSHRVWAVGKNGSAYRRNGIQDEKPEGDSWQSIEPPAGIQLKQISVGLNAIWALDNSGRLCVRKDISDVFPEGTGWLILTNDPSTTENNPNTSSGFRHVSVGRHCVWAVTNSGYICRRVGISTENPAGTGWNFGIGGNFQYVSARGLL